MKSYMFESIIGSQTITSNFKYNQLGRRNKFYLKKKSNVKIQYKGK